MKDRIFEPARHNEEAPAEGMGAVNTFNPEEAPLENLVKEREGKQEREPIKQNEGPGNTTKVESPDVA